MEDLTEAYENMAFIPDGLAYVTRWSQAAAAFRGEMGARFEGGFDPDTRRGADLVLPDGAPKGLMVFIHGGYWRLFSPRDWSHLARGGVEAGWAVVIPGYPLCPDVRISQITESVARLIVEAAARVEGPVVLTGHSAGGHLVARMCEVLPEAVRSRVTRVAPISMLSDLAPLMQTGLNDVLHIDAAEADAESPLRFAKPAGVDFHLWVGGDERPAFLDQTQWLADAWGVPQTVTPGKHHFDIVDLLDRSDSALLEWLLG
ncbi:MAG: alpha/beta hydrolase [Marinovum sp.]|nr:alpha/beta hydrolase [Marinovum sp.]